MSERKWLVNTDGIENKYSKEVNKLISLYIQAFHAFFNVTPTENMDIFFTIAENQCEKKSDFLFLDWLKNKGCIQLQTLIELTDQKIPYNTTVAAKINMVIGALEDELNWGERDMKSTRSTVINTLSNLTENLIQLSAMALEKEKIK